ncbi:MAG: protein phosphatase 2C domain-containing protein [Candidatus Gastranaerophilales bacterium]|nr:protein phosphatase 2C domain-containing protein [Candidatus Gastranaerophilales bacterium]
MSYKYYYSSVKGTSHIKTDTPKQDSLYVFGFVSDKKHYLISAVADGAGTAKYSDISSAFLCRYLAFQMKIWLTKRKDLSDFKKEIFCEWIKKFQILLYKKYIAKNKKTSLRDFSTTVLFSVLGDNLNVFAQIGDGAIAAGNQTELKCVFIPQKGEYANTTHFITEEHFEKYLMFASTDEKIERLAVHTDGIEMISLINLEKPSLQFFNPFFDCLADEPKGFNEELSKELSEFLSSDRVNSRTNDDKTLLIAMKEIIND